ILTLNSIINKLETLIKNLGKELCIEERKYLVEKNVKKLGDKSLTATYQMIQSKPFLDETFQVDCDRNNSLAEAFKLLIDLTNALSGCSLSYHSVEIKDLVIDNNENFC